MTPRLSAILRPWQRALATRAQGALRWQGDPVLQGVLLQLLTYSHAATTASGVDLLALNGRVDMLLGRWCPCRVIAAARGPANCRLCKAS